MYSIFDFKCFPVTKKVADFFSCYCFFIFSSVVTETNSRFRVHATEELSWKRNNILQPTNKPEREENIQTLNTKELPTDFFGAARQNFFPQNFWYPPFATLKLFETIIFFKAIKVPPVKFFGSAGQIFDQKIVQTSFILAKFLGKTLTFRAIKSSVKKYWA